MVSDVEAIFRRTAKCSRQRTGEHQTFRWLVMYMGCLQAGCGACFRSAVAARARAAPQPLGRSCYPRAALAALAAARGSTSRDTSLRLGISSRVSTCA